MQSAAGMEIEVYGTGNAAADFVNESYALRPSSTPTRPHRHQQQQTRSHTPSRNTSNPSPRGSGWNLWGSRQSSLRRRGRGGEEGGTPSSSTMAGLSRDGSRTGAARVGLWARHVLDDPAEGEGEWGDSDSDWVDDRNF
ncbi:hypothetical protein M501DRAFT_105509 [Patellaria atrata CBS 101060]|uniref:Uncharacterized protein n=1 Tax=Patellaria atrata CBS 101060 TaxID=1346257 RepID=A0A9P4SKQ1_9PEZI|nr:hypothetical protein M501DRAFT_105509 [Patellaria atrata CBS 101060]